MVTRLAAKLNGASLTQYRRAIITHLVRQSGGPSPDPRDALRLAANSYSLLPREARVGRFTARIARCHDGVWALDFNPAVPRYELVCAIWHELTELLCLTDDILSFESLDTTFYQESAASATDLRHICALGVERFVQRRLRAIPEVQHQLTADNNRRALLVRATTAASEPILPKIEREPWYDDETYYTDDSNRSAVA